jgi:DNA-binding transcriptional ArsR family regulator
MASARNDAAGACCDVAALARLVGVVADRTRLGLLLALARGEANVTALRSRLGCSQPQVSHHLGILRRGGFVTARRRGREVYYRLGAAARRRSPSEVEVADERGWIRITELTGG